SGSDMVPKLLEICAAEGHAVYFFGSDMSTLEEAKVIVEERYPGLKVAGMDSPPVGAVIDWDNDALCEKMRSSGAKLLLVCLGCPKQERWIFAHHKETGVPLSIGVGASLDFIAGKQKRAPMWMQKTGLEWFWRMSSSPKRLVSRYGKDLVFLTKAAADQARSQRRRGGIVPAARVATENSMPVERLTWKGELQKSDLSGAPLPEGVALPVLLDASQVTFMDSSGLGRLAALVRDCRSNGRQLVVTNASAAFRSPVASAKMESLFPIAENDDEAMRILVSRSNQSAPRQTSAEGVRWVSFEGSLDALQHDEMMAALETNIGSLGDDAALVIDLRKVDFIDSRAVGGLVRAWKLVSARGGSMFLHGAGESVREIIALLRLDKMLPEWKGEAPA
ncbi:MAG: WecB/TagA/CpsF family glycosyltransferase, partial [Verrucomicrobiae bacterium]|nr:WecB/TagA/CpsF family glycosyltransferase [Verrucomicrobiae bacterium]